MNGEIIKAHPMERPVARNSGFTKSAAHSKIPSFLWLPVSAGAPMPHSVLFYHQMKTTIAMLATFLTTSVLFAEDVKPLKVLLITGGCCHDYKKQKDILKTGIEARANVIVDQVHSDDSSVKPPLSIYGNAEYGKGYDVIIHDECSAGVSDPATIKAVLQPHADGTPGVNLHCGVHSYRIGSPGQKADVGSERAMWFDYLGIQSSGHGPQLPIAITVLDAANPVTKSLEIGRAHV